MGRPSTAAFDGRDLLVVNFQFQVSPVREVSGVFECAVPEVIFRLL